MMKHIIYDDDDDESCDDVRCDNDCHVDNDDAMMKTNMLNDCFCYDGGDGDGNDDYND